MSAPVMERLNASLTGRYRIERELGEGGMATVYMANDLRHDRSVALKLLKPELAAVVGAGRFLAEIKTTASLQHPHILPLFDSGEADGFLFYVMPYVEGESLRDRLDREHQLPVDDAVGMAHDMAEALHYAHRQGVIHRDIKPANVLLLEGRPVISDFGIALAVGAAGEGRLTETGLSLGTPHYMSPEQATGDANVGPAADVYALGCVLYEMLVGEPPFTGSTPQAVLGKIITGKADLVTEHRTTVPPNVAATVARALEKVPADRFRDAAEMATALRDPAFRHGASAEATATGADQTRWKAAAVVSTVLFAVASVVAAAAILRPPPPVPVARFLSPFLQDQAAIGPMRHTPDGSALVYTGPDASGLASQLWMRRWDDLSANPVPGTEGARQTALGQISVSPDGLDVAFTTGNPGVLRVVPLSGGPGRTIVDAASAAGDWSADGWIYFQTVGTAIQRIRALGGTPETLTEVTEGELYHTLPALLPGDETLVFQVFRAGDGSDAEIWWLNVETRERRMVVTGNHPRWAPTGHLLFGTPEGMLMAVSFDPASGEMTGSPVPVLEGMLTDALRGVVQFDLSRTGTLVYRSGGGGALGRYEFIWAGRGGQVTPIDPGHSFVRPASNFGWRLSPDGTRIVFNSLMDGQEDVRIKHLPDGPEERITFSDDSDIAPFWAPDGQSVSYFAGPIENRNVSTRRADGTGEPVVILDDEGTYAQGTWSPDGTWLLLRTGATAATGVGLRDILAFRPGIDSAPRPLVATSDFAEADPVLSPDGRWLAYSSNETGRYEVYVRPFPDVGASRVRVSTDAGLAPRWSGDGRELFFASPEGFFAADFDPAAGRVLGLELLFEPPPEAPAAVGSNFYDVTPDGQRFLMVRPLGAELTDEVVVVQGFFEEIRERMGR